MQKLLFFALVFLLFNCTEDKIETKHFVKVDINAEVNQNLPQLKNVSLKPLETQDESIFATIINVEYFKGKIYVLDGFSTKSLLAFSENGQFINKTRQGKGIGEMIKPFAFYIDKKEEVILVWDEVQSTMFTYDLDLKYISQKKSEIQYPMLLEFAKMDNNKIIARTHDLISEKQQEYVFKLYTSDFGEVENTYLEDFKYFHQIGLSKSISSNKNPYLISAFDYNIYQLVDNKLKSEFYFDFGKYKLVREELEDEKNGNKHRELLEQGKRVSSLHTIQLSQNYLSFKVFYKLEPIYYLQSLNQDNLYRLNDYFENGMLPKCDIQSLVNGDTFLAFVNPDDLIAFQEKTGQKLFEGEINSNQNPFILTFSL
ncbi:MAG: hypothetical protein CMO01_07000 [Thalassobius sp.]|nr:hypothetical protein [Thalassovita sp.]